MSKNNLKLFDDYDDMQKWKEHWQDMPEFEQEDLEPHQKIIISFESKEDVKKFSELIDQKLTYKTKSIWYPEVEKGKFKNYHYGTNKK